MANSLMNKNTWDGKSEAYIALFDPNTNLPIGEMLKFDATQLGGSSVERIIHSKLLVIVSGNTSYINNSFLTLNCAGGNPMISSTEGSFNSGDISPNYVNSKWAFYRFDGTLISDGNVFSTVADMYNYLQTVVANDGTRYTEDVMAVVYDEIDNSIEPIEKIYGVNIFRQILNSGSKKNDYWLNSGGGVRWDYLNGFIEDIYNITNIAPGKKYSAGDERIFKFPNNYKKSFSGYHSSTAASFRINLDKWCFNMSDGTISTNHSGIFYQDFNMSKYFYRAISDDSVYNYIDWGDIKTLNTALLDSNSSVISVNVFRKADDDNIVTVYLKPVNIDVIYLDYFDKTKYDLYKVVNSVDSYQHFVKIDTTQLEQSQVSNVTRLLPSDYYRRNLHNRRSNKFSITGEFDYRFVLKDKETNTFSPISEMKVNWSSPPKRNSAIYCRITK